MAFALVLVIVASAVGQFNGGVLLGLMALFIAFFASCIGPVFWTLVPEIFPNNVRGRAMIVPVVTQWVTNALVVLLFPLAFNRVGKLTTFAFLALHGNIAGIVRLASFAGDERENTGRD